MTGPIDCDGCGARILPIGTRCPLCGHEHDDTPDVTVTHEIDTATTNNDPVFTNHSGGYTEWSFTLW